MKVILVILSVSLTLPVNAEVVPISNEFISSPAKSNAALLPRKIAADQVSIKQKNKTTRRNVASKEADYNIKPADQEIMQSSSEVVNAIKRSSVMKTRNTERLADTKRGGLGFSDSLISDSLAQPKP